MTSFISCHPSSIQPSSYCLETDRKKNNVPIIYDLNMCNPCILSIINMQRKIFSFYNLFTMLNPLLIVMNFLEADQP